MVIGSSLDDFWILSRTPVLPTGVRQHLLAQAQQIGVDLDRILWVMQDGANPTGS
ncbi:MAG: lipocalin family protein [Comamonas sp.]